MKSEPGSLKSIRIIKNKIKWIHYIIGNKMGRKDDEKGEKRGRKYAINVKAEVDRLRGVLVEALIVSSKDYKGRQYFIKDIEVLERKGQR